MTEHTEEHNEVNDLFEKIIDVFYEERKNKLTPRKFLIPVKYKDDMERPDVVEDIGFQMQDGYGDDKDYWKMRIEFSDVDSIKVSKYERDY